MVLCIIALPLFALLAIFSAKYRRLTKDSLDCIFKSATFRKCSSGLDDRIRADITGRVLKFSPRLAKFVYKNYKIITWIILILFLWGTYESGIAIYNYINYGNCNGPSDDGFCIFDPLGENSKTSSCGSSEIETEYNAPEIGDEGIWLGDPNAELTIIEFGCYTCPYTRQAHKTVQKILETYDGKVNLQFRTLIIPEHEMSYESSMAALCAREQGKEVEYHDALFEAETLSEELFTELASDLQLGTKQFTSCLQEEKYKKEIDTQNLIGLNSGVRGTPTFFINDQVIVGPKPFKTFKKIIDSEL